MKAPLTLALLTTLAAGTAEAAAPSAARTTHQRAVRSKALVLSDKVAVQQVTVIRVVDQEVHFYAVDPASMPKGIEPPISRATLAPGVGALLVGKQGQTVTLHFARDGRGAPYVTRVLRPTRR